MDDALWNLKLRSLEVSIVAIADRLAVLENAGHRHNGLEAVPLVRQQREPNYTDVIQPEPCSCDESVALRKQLVELDEALRQANLGQAAQAGRLGRQDKLIEHLQSEVRAHRQAHQETGSGLATMRNAVAQAKQHALNAAGVLESAQEEDAAL